MTEPGKSPDAPRDDTVVRKAVDQNAGSEFDTAEMPALTDTPNEGDADLDDTVISVKRLAGERATRVIQHKDPAADEFATRDQKLADADRPGSDFPTGYYSRGDFDAMADPATREVRKLPQSPEETHVPPPPATAEHERTITDHALPQDEPEPIKPIIETARRAFREWSALRFEQRMPCFDKLRAELVIQRNDYAPSLASSIGRPILETLYVEYMPVLEALRTLEDVVPPLLHDQHGAPAPRLANGAGTLVRGIPWGVVAIYTPSDAPFALPMILAIDALATGNAVLLCPGERHPRVAEMIRKLLTRAGFPEGLVQLIGGEWRDRRALLEAGPDLVIFEGEAGQADQVARAGVELGFGVRLSRATKEMLLVLDGADVQHAVSAALWAGYAGGGFVRGRVERIVVDAGIYDEFRMHFLDGLRTLNSHHAQLANISDLLRPQRFQTVISDAVSRGARVTWPAGEEPGRWIHWKGGVIESLPDRALASVERIEGPALALYRAEDVAAEALRLHRVAPACNVSVIGPASRSVRAELERLPVARISFGEPLLGGGSFHGGGADGLNTPRAGAGPRMMLRPQVIVEAGGDKRRVGWFPYTDDKAYALMEAIEADYHTDLARRLQAGLRLGLNGHKRRLLRGEM